MKPNVKQILNLIAAVGAILFAALLLIGFVQSIAGVIDELKWSISDVGGFVLKIVYLSAVAVTIVFLILSGTKVCKDKNAKSPAIIMLIVFYAAGLLLAILGISFNDAFGALAAFEIVFAIAGLGLLITSLSLGAYTCSDGEPKSGAYRGKVDFLKQLKEEGTITQEEYKKLVLKELE